MKKIGKIAALCLCAVLMGVTIIFSGKITISAASAPQDTANKIAVQYKGISDQNTIDELLTLSGSGASDSDINKKISEIILSAKAKEKYNFQLISDVHMSLDNSSEEQTYGDTYQYLTDALEYISIKYSDTSGVLVPGDITCHGYEGEYLKYEQALEKSYMEYNLPLVITSIGNHEFYNENDVNNPLGTRSAELAVNYFTKTLNDYFDLIGLKNTNKVYYDTYIGGDHIIVLGSEQDGEIPGQNPYCYAYISDEQISWFKQKLAETEPDRPIYVLMHQPLDDTVYLSDKWGAGEKATAALREILQDYPQAIIFSGHVHNGIIGEDAIFANGYGISFDLPAFEYNDIKNFNSHIGYNAAVYSDRIIFTPINFDTYSPIYSESVMLNLEFGERFSSAYDLKEASSLFIGGGLIKDYGADIYGDGARIEVTSGAVTSVKIEVSVDSEAYTVIYDGNLNYPQSKNKIYFEETLFRYLKVTVTGGNGNLNAIATWYGESKTELRKLFRLAETFDETLYTQENANAIIEAKDSAAKVMSDKNATAQEIASAEQMLSSALENKIITEKPVNPDTPQKDISVTVIIAFCAGAAVILGAAAAAVFIIKKKSKKR